MTNCAAMPLNLPGLDLVLYGFGLKAILGTPKRRPQKLWYETMPGALSFQLR